MWLLNTETVALTQFLDDRKAPGYAILSHTWENEEVSLQEIQLVPRPLQVTEKAGFKKILSCCAQAAEDGFEWVWIDTCCIDKTNSVELSEAINSMFRWYGNAVVCYAYLVDVEIGDTPEYQGSQFRKSRWFTRGWTLQELLAPRSVVFFNREWVETGTKLSLSRVVEGITEIGAYYVKRGYRCDSPSDMRDLGLISSAQKMFWASQRETTRLEDVAYCLMGLFDINMPMIYGEGAKAFERLQLEIIKSTADQSIFFWYPFNGRACGPLAMSPKDFQRSDQVKCGPSNSGAEFSITNKGLRITLPLTGFGDSIVAVLNCFRFDGRQCGIRLQKRDTGEHNTYFRVANDELESFDPTSGLGGSTIYIRDFSLLDSLSVISPQEAKFRVLELRHHNNLLPIYQNMRCHRISCFQRDRVIKCRRVLENEYGTTLKFDASDGQNQAQVMLIFEELSHQNQLFTGWPDPRTNYFALHVTLQPNSCRLALLIPSLLENGRKASALEWHGEARAYGSDRQVGYLQDGTCVRIALKTVMIDSIPGHQVHVTSQKNFGLVSMGSPCCYPVEGFNENSWPRYSAIRDLFKQSTPQRPAS